MAPSPGRSNGLLRLLVVAFLVRSAARGGSIANPAPASLHSGCRGTRLQASEVPPSLRHWQRRRHHHQRQPAEPAPSLWVPVIGWGGPMRPCWRRPCRRLFQRQRQAWGQQRLRRRCSCSGIRVGKALHPGPLREHSPPPLEPAAVRRRVQAADATVRCFCPVPGCGMGDPLRAVHATRHWLHCNSGRDGRILLAHELLGPLGNHKLCTFSIGMTQAGRLTLSQPGSQESLPMMTSAALSCW